MLVGTPSIFAIESSITIAYERLSFRALGYFVLHLSGKRYGQYLPDATMLACSYDEVIQRVSERGNHVAPFANEGDAGQIAKAFRQALYSEEQADSYFGIPLADFVKFFSKSEQNIMWAPDGDEAFDDHSYVLQFDIGNQVRLIAFKSGANYLPDPETLSDLWLDAEDFYKILQTWHESFHAEWVLAQKVKAE